MRRFEAKVLETSEWKWLAPDGECSRLDEQWDEGMVSFRLQRAKVGTDAVMYAFCVKIEVTLP